MAAIASAYSAGATLTTTLSTIGAAVATGVMRKVNTIRAANTSVSAAGVDVAWTDGTNTYYLAKSVNINAGQALDILELPLFLPAGYSLKARASAGTSIDLTVNGMETAA